jgi:hypothetical protein
VPERRGQQAWVHWRLQGPTFLRQSCVAWAAEAIRHAFWAQVYDQPQREKGKAHQAAGRALAWQWLRILYRCWQERTPDEESIALQARTRRGSSLLHQLAQEASKASKPLDSPPQGMCSARSHTSGDSGIAVSGTGIVSN